MIDIDKHVAYWHNSALEDWKAAQDLVKAKHIRHGLFFAHLALEKMLKAHVTKHTGDIPPRIHNLLSLAKRAGFELTVEQETFLGRFETYQLEGRYPPLEIPQLSLQKAEQELKLAQEYLNWLIKLSSM